MQGLFTTRLNDQNKNETCEPEEQCAGKDVDEGLQETAHCAASSIPDAFLATKNT